MEILFTLAILVVMFLVCSVVSRNGPQQPDPSDDPHYQPSLEEEIERMKYERASLDKYIHELEQLRDTHTDLQPTTITPIKYDPKDIPF